MTRREWIALAAAGAIAKAEVRPSIIGNGWGLDHFMTVLADPESVKSTYVTKLGFTVFPGAKRPDGYENAVIILGPAYIELLSFYDRDKAKASGDAHVKELFDKAVQGGGPVGYNVNVSPVDRAAATLRERGMEVSLPLSQVILRDGKEVRGGWQFLNIAKTGKTTPSPGVPGGDAVGFLEYRDNQRKMAPKYSDDFRARAEREFPDPRRRAGEIHPNTARWMRSVWVAVESVSDAVKQSEIFGFAGAAARENKSLGARGREVECGRGTIVFWEAAKPGTPLSGLIKSRGLGAFGVSIDVVDLKLARRIAEKGIGKKLPMDVASPRKNFVVPGELTGGVWIEFGELTS